MQNAQHINWKAGFALIGVIVALTILTVLGFGLSTMIAENQSTRSQQLYMDQAFLTAHASFEYSLRQIEMGTNPNPLPVRVFATSAFALNRYLRKIWTVETDVTASNSFSVNDPNPPLESSCLIVGTGGATYRANTKQLIGVTLQRDVTKCPNPIVITSMIISWSPNGNERVTELQFNNAPTKEFHDAAGLKSGSTFPLSPVVSYPDGSVQLMTDIQWKTSITTPSSITLTYILEDNSTVVVHLSV
jgi:hypothetical protein